MSFVDPIIQGYIYSDVYNNMGGGNSTTTAGLSISKIVESTTTYGGGKKLVLDKQYSGLSVPVGLVLMESNSNERINYTRAKKPTTCEVIPDELFSKLIEEVSPYKSHRKRNSQKKQRDKPIPKNKTSNNAKKKLVIKK